MTQVAIVTGGGGGIGFAIAAKVTAAGGSVVIGDLNDDRGRDAVARLGDRSRFVRSDVSEESDVESLVTAAIDSVGRLDAMFTNAGVGGALGAAATASLGRLDAVFNHAGVGRAFGPITEQTVEAWDATFAINVRSVFLGTKHAAKQMIEQGTGGAIVNTASVAGLSGGGGPQ